MKFFQSPNPNNYIQKYPFCIAYPIKHNVINVPQCKIKDAVIKIVLLFFKILIANIFHFIMI